MRKTYTLSLILGIAVALIISYAAMVIWSGDVFVKFSKSFSTAERFSVLALPTLSVTSVFLLIYLFQGWRAERIAAYGIIIITVACVGTALIIRENYVTLLVAWLATLGWLMSNMVSIRNARITHTFNILVELRSNRELHRHRENIFSTLGYTTRLTKDDVIRLTEERDHCKDWANSYPVIESITFLANLYDNIAYGARYHDLDTDAVRLNIRNLIIYFYHDYYEFIEYHNNQDPRRLEHLIWLAKEFDADVPTS